MIALPSTAALEQAYEKLIFARPSAPSPSELALYSQWSRLDPRLAELIVEYLFSAWKSIDPMALRRALLQLPWAAAFAALCEFVLIRIESESEDSRLFHKWADLICEGFPCGSDEQFFIGLRQIGGKEMELDARFPLHAYQKWGYLARENLVHRQARAGFSKATRLNILEDLMARLPRIRTQDYVQALEGSVSDRQAQRDLEQCPSLKAVGHTRARYFVPTPHRRRKV